MGRKAKQALLPLCDEQIATRWLGDGPRVATQVRSGRCNSKAECEAAGGTWGYPEHSIYPQCIGAKCVDSGSGDWD